MLTLIQTVARRPWAIQAEVAAHVQGLLHREGIAGLRHLAELKRIAHAWDDEEAGPRGARGRGRGAQAGSTVAVVPVHGVLTQREEMDMSSTTRSTTGVAEEVQEAVGDPKVDAVVLDIDSPGGEVYGVPEAFSALRDAGKAKPIVAVANSVAASAALYLAAAANEVWVTPSGEAGSVGVYALHVDASKAIDQMGEAWEFIVADESPYKTEGAPTGPLSDDARADLRKMVNRYMSMFVRDLARGRGVSMDHVRENFGKGRMLSPQEAVAARMADRVGTFEDAIRRAAQLGRERREGAPAARAEAPGPEPQAVAEPVPAGPTPAHEAEEGARRAALGRLGSL
jgi:signal peptide peptidase SppA